MSSSKSIGFRLEETQVDQLAALAAAQGTSPGAYARSLVLAAIDNTQGQEIQDALQNLRAEVETLRGELQARDTTAALRALHEGIAQLTASVHSMLDSDPATSFQDELSTIRQSIDSLVTAAHQAPSPSSQEFSALRTRMDTLTAAIRNPPAPAGVDALRKSMDALTNALTKIQASSKQDLDALRTEIKVSLEALHRDIATATLAVLVSAREQPITTDQERNAWKKEASDWVDTVIVKRRT